MHFQVLNHHGTQLLAIDDQQLLLDALRQAGHEVPASCRNGNCGLCHTELLSGCVRQRQRELRAPTRIALCIANARSELTLGPLPEKSATVRLACQVLGWQNTTLSLRLPAGRQPLIQPGQSLYLPAPLDQSATVLGCAGRELLLALNEVSAHARSETVVSVLYRRR